MNRGNFEVGVQRLYYVVWTVWSTGWVAALMLNFYEDGFDMDRVVLRGGIWLGIIAPPLIMFAVRWIYRGFFPKADAA
ncbi:MULTISPECIES: hypothetical protein [unclassified Variovorax]|uniref:hypothetical protein n=1 Tax=unclassified Variovorax TaxID=663243 RepID=UPI00076BE270|nr:MULTISPECIES: hypothetical protein [unclassified Variovorax]KWT83707.1 hypothetical protein APY03_4262 [Variovorax sp. WDL1]PNG46384.1 hypothetical protein CHC06_06725 [Variovorax sp. B2]PNG47794.1 hypothetical protein CHC07_06962 [Variovorax sp. B4]VTV14119.1 hypothetical protein WDL1CHR_04698 [Variovorax sp. WDL1]